MTVLVQYEPGEGPEFKVQRHGRTVTRRVDRIVTGFAGAQHVIFQPVGEAKPRELCQPFTFELYADRPDVKAQEKFVKGFATLEKKIARERKAREKRAKVAA